MSLLSKIWEYVRKRLKLPDKEFISSEGDAKAAVHRLLCVDDDKYLCLYVKKVASFQNIIVETAYTIAEAQKKIEQQSPFEAFIIDGHLPDGSGFDLVSWVRQHYPEVPIIFLSRVYQDAASFRILKEQFDVDYVLEKPLTPQKIDLIFKQLWRGKLQPPSSLNDEEAELEAFIADIKHDYKQSIYQKLERLEKLILNVQRKPNLKNLIELRREVHNVGGSSGSYGFPEVGEVCQALEIDIDKQIEQQKHGPLDLNWLASLDDFFSQMKLYFQLSPQLFNLNKSEEVLPAGTPERPFVYLVHSDESFLKDLNSYQKPHEGLILSESDPEKAKEKLRSQTFDPQVVIVNTSYPASSITGIQLLEILNQKNVHLPIETGLIIRGAEQLAESLARGICYIFQQPFSAEGFYHFLKEIRVKAPNLRALLLEKDSDIYLYICRSLNEIGIECQLLQDAVSLWDLHLNDRPHLFILDIQFAEQDPDLLSRLKDDERFKGIPVLLVATKHEQQRAEEYYQRKLIKDIIIKPLYKHEFQNKVLTLLKQQHYLFNGEIKNRLLSKELFEHYLYQKFMSYQELQLQSWSAIVLCELEGFSSLFEQLGKQKEEELIVKIGQALYERLLRREVCAYIREGVFAILFSGLDLNYIQIILKDFLSKLQSDLNEFVAPSTLKFNCGVAMLPLENSQIPQLMRKAERALQYARQQSGESIKIAALPEDQQQFQEKEMTLMGTGCHKLIEQFSSRGFKIEKLKNGQEFLNRLFQEKNLFFPLLVVTDALKDERGAKLAKELKNHYRLQFPILMMHFFAEEEVGYQLQRKLLNYEENPFNLMILFQNDSS